MTWNIFFLPNPDIAQEIKVLAKKSSFQVWLSSACFILFYSAILLFIGLVKTSLWHIWLILVCPGFDIEASRLSGEPNIKSWTDQYHLKLGKNRQKFYIWRAMQWRAKYQNEACLNPISLYLSNKLVLTRPINGLYGE